MNPEGTRFGVWVYHDDPAWLAAGVPGVQLTHAQELSEAIITRDRLAMIAPDREWHIRNERDELVEAHMEEGEGLLPKVIVTNVQPLSARRAPAKARRTLGTRGQA